MEEDLGGFLEGGGKNITVVDLAFRSFEVGFHYGRHCEKLMGVCTNLRREYILAIIYIDSKLSRYAVQKLSR